MREIPEIILAKDIRDVGMMIGYVYEGTDDDDTLMRAEK